MQEITKVDCMEEFVGKDGAVKIEALLSWQMNQLDMVQQSTVRLLLLEVEQRFGRYWNGLEVAKE